MVTFVHCLVFSVALGSPPSRAHRVEAPWPLLPAGWTASISARSRVVARATRSPSTTPARSSATAIPRTARTHAFAVDGADGLIDLGTLPGGTVQHRRRRSTRAGRSPATATPPPARRTRCAGRRGCRERSRRPRRRRQHRDRHQREGTVVGNSMTRPGEQHAFTFTAPPARSSMSARSPAAQHRRRRQCERPGHRLELHPRRHGQAHAFLWTNGAAAPTDIGTADVHEPADGHQRRGPVVGCRQPIDNAAGQTGFLRAAAHLIGATSGFTSANAINAAARSSARCARRRRDRAAGLLAQPAGVITPIATLGGTYGVAYAVNAAGASVGSSTIADDAARPTPSTGRRPVACSTSSTIGGDHSYGDGSTTTTFRGRQSSTVERRHPCDGLAAHGGRRHDAPGDHRRT